MANVDRGPDGTGNGNPGQGGKGDGRDLSLSQNHALLTQLGCLISQSPDL